MSGSIPQTVSVNGYLFTVSVDTSTGITTFTTPIEGSPAGPLTITITTAQIVTGAIEPFLLAALNMIFTGRVA